MGEDYVHIILIILKKTHCNLKANQHRKEWTEYYQEKLSKLYNYQYEKGEIIITQ